MIIQANFHRINDTNTMKSSKLSKLGGRILARGKIEDAKWKNMDSKF